LGIVLPTRFFACLPNLVQLRLDLRLKNFDSLPVRFRQRPLSGEISRIQIHRDAPEPTPANFVDASLVQDLERGGIFQQKVR